MPELDFALLSDYVRVEGGIAHVIAAGVDTVFAPSTPAGQNFGLLFRVAFSRTECGRPHRVEVIVMAEDGERLAQISTAVTPAWNDALPAHWSTRLLGGFNFGVPLPHYGLYSFEIMINDTLAKSLPLRVIEPPFEPPADDEAPGEE